MRLARRAVSTIAALMLGVGLPAGTQAPAYAADPVAGAQTSGDVLFPNVGNGGYDVQHYDVDLAWTPGATLAASEITATTTIDAVTTGPPLSSFSLDLEGLVVDTVTVDGVPATWTRDEDVDAIRHKLVITPAEPVDGAFTTVVSYHGVPTSHTDADGSSEGWNVTSDGATFLNQPVGAMTGFPNNNTPNDKATYTLALDVPTTITNAAGAGSAAAVSNGELLSRATRAGGTRTTWVWEQKKQMATSLVLISIGKYDVLESNLTLSSGRVVREWSFVDSALSAATKDTINTRRASMPTIIRGLETVYGPYPGNSVGVVVDTVPAGISYALETQDRSFFPGSIPVNTLIHELAHQWYGDAVSPRVWNDIWINEGMGTWAPSYYNSAIAGTSPTSTETTYFNSWNNRPAASVDWTIPPSGMTDSADLYGYQTYTRSGQMYEALKTAIGDVSFFAFLREWQRRYDGQSQGGVQFEALAEEISGRDLTAFFQDWVYDADKPAWPAKFTLGLASTPASGDVAPGATVTYALTSVNTGRVVQDGSVVRVDLADVLDDATLDPATLPSSMTLDGTTLSWTVPSTAVGATTTESFSVTLRSTASGAWVGARVLDTTLGSTCGTCTSTLTVPVQAGPPPTAPVPTTVATTVVGKVVEKGANKVGRKVRVVLPALAPGATVTYTWKVAGKAVTSSGGPSLRVKSAYLGKKVKVVIRATSPGSTPLVKRASFGRAVR